MWSLNWNWIGEKTQSLFKHENSETIVLSVGNWVIISDILQEENEEDLGEGCKLSLCWWVQDSNRDSEDWWSGLPCLEVDPAYSKLWQDLLDALQSLAGER